MGMAIKGKRGAPITNQDSSLHCRRILCQEKGGLLCFRLAVLIQGRLPIKAGQTKEL